MHTVKLVIQHNRVKRNGETSIYLQYSFSREKRKLFKTNKSVPPQFWDKKNSRVRSGYPNATHINSFLNALKHKMEMIIDQAMVKKIIPTVDYVYDMFYDVTAQKSVIDTIFFDEFNKFLEFKKTRVSVDCIKDYNSLKKHLKGWEKSERKTVSFEGFDDNFFYSFVHYLEYGLVQRNGSIGLQKNSVHKVIKNLKSFLNHCMKTNVCARLDLSGYKVTLTKTQAVYVSEPELDRIMALELPPKSELDLIRDMFIIGCETGLRYSDFSRLGWNHIDEDMRLIRITVTKTLDSVVIPISVRLRNVLDKYDLPVRRALPTYFLLDVLNKEIKEIAKSAGLVQQVTKWKVVGNEKIEITKPKYELISSHTCRRSFCTNQFLKGMPALLIRRISGHKKEGTFMRYIRIDEEEAALKMIELWEEIGET